MYLHEKAQVFIGIEIPVGMYGKSIDGTKKKKKYVHVFSQRGTKKKKILACFLF